MLFENENNKLDLLVLMFRTEKKYWLQIFGFHIFGLKI
jgi:hypothetical protein